MEKSKIRETVLLELKKLISQSCKNPTDLNNFKQLHIAVLKKYYCATDVSIDYHRKRIQMNVIQDESAYDPNKLNSYLPTFYTNILFQDLCTFLSSCLVQDHKSIGFYAQLLHSFGKTKKPLELVQH